jgi:hypothetical protein
VKRSLYLPIVLALLLWTPLLTTATAQTRRVNVPLFDSVRPSEAAAFWFGAVDASQNYADVRIGFTPQELWVRVSVFDQWLWLDDSASRTPASLETWDAVSLFVDSSGTPSTVPQATSYRFVGELSSWRPRTDYQAAWVGNGSTWSPSGSTTFSTETVWRGDSPNNGGADRGWVITFHIPFSSIGVTGPPPSGTVWNLAVQVHDRDSQAGSAVSDKFWPEALVRDRPNTWGQLAFGLRPDGALPTPPGADTYTIRHGLDGATVTDAMVGGGSTCAEGTDFYNAWGRLTYPHSTTLVVQNQGDVADWPCFSKFYLEFPLSSLPAGKSVASADLTIYQFGGSDPSQALRSLVQVSTINEPWNENTITWNNAPLALENVAQTWVDVIPAAGVPWPGAARVWNLSAAVREAYASGQSVLRLVVYEADGAYHSGKYFTSSDTGEWNAVGRPTLRVIVSDAIGVPQAPTNVRIISSN